MCVIKLKPIRLYLLQYLFQTGTNLAIRNKIPFSDENHFGTLGWSSGTNWVPANGLTVILSKTSYLPVEGRTLKNFGRVTIIFIFIHQQYYSLSVSL
jgi:hypothetical protein